MDLRPSSARVSTSLVAALVVVSGMAGCSFLRAATGIGFQHPTLAYESWSADQLDLDGVTIALHYRFENPNDFSLDLRRLDYRLEVEARQVAQGELPAGVDLRARGATPLAIPVRLRWRDVPDAVSLFLTRREVSYRVSGTAGIGSAVGTVAIPFEHDGRVALPRPPSVGIEGITMRDLSTDGVAVDLRLRIENDNAFPLPVGVLTYGLRVGESDVLSRGTYPLAAVPPRGAAVVTVPVRISLQGAADAVAELMRGAALQLRGLAGYGEVETPVDTQGRLGR